MSSSIVEGSRSASVDVEPKKQEKSEKHKGLPRFWGALVFMGLTGLSLLGSFIETLFIARWGGASAQIDAFLLGKSLPDVLINLFSVAAYIAIIPVLVEKRRLEGESAFWALGRSMALLMAGIALVLSVIFMLFSPVIIRLMAHNYDPHMQLIAVRTMQILFAAIPFVIVLMMFRSVFEANGLFWPSTLPGIIRSCFVVAGVVAFATIVGVLTVPTCIMISQVFSTLVVIYISLKRFPGQVSGPWLQGIPPELKKVGWSLIPVTVALTIYNIFTLLDRVMAVHLKTGAIANLNYAYMLALVPHALIGATLGTLVYPSLAAAKHDADRLRSLVLKGWRITLFLALPAAAIMIMQAPDTVLIAFERGQFTPADTAEVSRYLVIYTLALPVLGFVSISSRALAALQDNRALLMISIAAIASKIASGLVLVPVLGAAGVAWTTCIGIVVYFLTSVYFIRRYAGCVMNNEDLKSGLHSLVACFLAVMVAFFLRGALFATGKASLFAAVLELSSVGVILFMVYLSVLFWLRSAELGLVISQVRRQPHA